MGSWATGGIFSPISPPTSDQRERNKRSMSRQQRVVIRVNPHNKAPLPGRSLSPTAQTPLALPPDLLPLVHKDLRHQPEEKEKPPAKATERAAAFIFTALILNKVPDKPADRH